MLIKCDRHTKEDLEMWNELEEADLIYSKDEKFENKIKRAVDSIKEFISNRDCYSGVSWGKDSVVVADLICRNQLDIPLVHLYVKPSHNPYCDNVRDEFLRLYSNIKYDEIIVNYKNILAMNLTDSEQDKQTDKLFYAGFKKAEIKYGDNHISGVRGQESGRRAIRMKMWGISSKKTCAPIGYWKVEDVFAYLAKYNLPVHPNYAMLGAGRWDRRKIRVAELGDITGRGIGRLEWEMEYYPDILRRNRIL